MLFKWFNWIKSNIRKNIKKKIKRNEKIKNGKEISCTNLRLFGIVSNLYLLYDSK